MLTLLNIYSEQSFYNIFELNPKKLLRFFGFIFFGSYHPSELNRADPENKLLHKDLPYLFKRFIHCI